MGEKPTNHPSLAEVAAHIPVGFECRGCGGSAYNWIQKCARYAETGEGCCADFREWVRKAKAGEPNIEQKRATREHNFLTAYIDARNYVDFSRDENPYDEMSPTLPAASAHGGGR